MEKAKVIAIANYKGGVGKTTTTLALGRSLSMQGKKVLLVDCDDSGNPSLSINLNLTNGEDRVTITDLFFDHIAVLSGAMKASRVTSAEDAIIHIDDEDFDVIPADNALAAITAKYFATLPEAINPAVVLDYILADLFRSKGADYYDYILIDAAPALNIMSRNILCAADEVIIPAQAQASSTDGVTGLISFAAEVKEMLNLTLVVRGVLVTMLDNRTRYSKDKAADMENVYGNLGLKVFNTRIPRGTKAEECVEKNQSIITFDPKGKVAQAYIALADEYLRG